MVTGSWLRLPAWAAAWPTELHCSFTSRGGWHGAEMKESRAASVGSGRYLLSATRLTAPLAGVVRAPWQGEGSWKWVGSPLGAGGSGSCS